MIALLDADILAYRIAFACDGEGDKVARLRLNSYVIDILTWGVDKTFDGCYVDAWILYLTGKGNFRHSIATTAVYKGNRTAPKPKHLSILRDFLVKEWNAEVVAGEEADDAIAIAATTLGDNSIMVSVDKDFDQIPGWHYNFNKQLGYYITPEQGILNFYKQILTGDAADNIIGIKGIGPVKSSKLLEDIADEKTLYKKCLEAYDGDAARVLENGQLLWLRRQPNQLWQPPI
jgi:DNA polymerase-1